MNSTVLSNDPFASDVATSDQAEGWKPDPTISHPGRMTCTMDPFENAPPIPAGYEPIPGDPRTITPGDDRAIRPISPDLETEAPLPATSPPRQIDTERVGRLIAVDTAEAVKVPRTDPPKASVKLTDPPDKQVPWREPASQAEHMKAIRESRSLKKYPRLVAFEGHVQMGLTSVERKVSFSKVKRELTSEYLAMFTGLSARKVDEAMTEACRLGFFRRIDNRKGGRGNTNRATYVPTVPAWTSLTPQGLPRWPCVH